MDKVSIVFFLFVSLCDCTKHEYISYNSSDLSYLSNGIQFPVPVDVDDANLVRENVKKQLPEMEWLLNLYNHHNWDKQLQNVNEECKSDMIVYLKQLKNGTLWAAKMYDASGHYNRPLFFGNDFWLGSMTLCYELANKETNLILPPFPVHFFAAKIRININKLYTPVTRQIIIGQCLPKSCNATDVRAIFMEEHSQAKSLKVIDIRPVPGTYNIYNDRKFFIVGGTTLIVFILIIISTLIEYYLTKRSIVASTCNEGEESNNNNENKLKKDSKKDEITNFGKGFDFLLSFSAISNSRAILSVGKVSRESIRCVHGLRFFSIVWIIMVHTYLEVFSIAENKTFRTLTERSFLYQTVSNATFSVDTFFFISGLLVTITSLRSSSNKQQNVQQSITQFFLLIIYRFLRLTPAYLFVIGLNEIVSRYTHSQSVYSPAMIDHITCDLYWWRNALYINNFYPQHEFCMLWSWYIANDTQFYVLATIFCIIAIRSQKHLKWIGVTMFTFLVTSWMTTFLIAMKYKYFARVEEPFALFDQLYDKPWLRIGPYLIGMATGYFLYKNKIIKLPSIVVIVAWILSISCLLGLVYGLGRDGLVVPLSALYAALGHTAWGLCLAWMTIACCNGYGGAVDSILSFKGFLPLSRLSYCAYLVHPVMMVYTSFLMDGPIHLHQLNVLVIFLGNSVVSFMIAFFISIAFEAPVVRLLKIIFASKPKE